MPKNPPKKYGPTREELIEQLAKIAAKLAGRSPEEDLIVRLGDVEKYRGPAWQYPEHMEQAEAALIALSYKQK